MEIEIPNVEKNVCNFSLPAIVFIPMTVAVLAVGGAMYGSPMGENLLCIHILSSTNKHLRFGPPVQKSCVPLSPQSKNLGIAGALIRP